MTFEQVILSFLSLSVIIVVVLGLFTLLERVNDAILKMSEAIKLLSFMSNNKKPPMKPNIKQEDFPQKENICPVCGKRVWMNHNFCDNCGQAIDWDDKEKKQ